MSITLKPIYANPTCRQVVSNGTLIGLLYKPQSERDKWQFWPRLPAGVVTSNQVCEFADEAAAIKFLGSHGAESVRA